MGLDFFNPKITRQGLFSTLKSWGDDFFVHDYHGAYTFFSLLKSRGAEFFCTKKSRGAEFFAEKNHGAQSFFALKNHGANTFFDGWKY